MHTNDYKDLEDIPRWRSILSNMYECDIPYDQENWKSVENLYQACKISVIKRIDVTTVNVRYDMTSLSPKRCKRLTSKSEMRVSDEALARWESKRQKIMYAILSKKLRHVPEFASTLKATGTARLIHFSRGHGGDAHALGETLMHLRDHDLKGPHDGSTVELYDGSVSGHRAPSHDNIFENSWGVFFWRVPGYLSNWTDSPFKYGVGKDEWFYRSAEQAIMHRKALLFGDMAAANDIIRCPNPLVCKKIGRKVKGFDDDRWRRWVESNLVHILYQKFAQNPLFAEALIATGDKMIFEASPYDEIWGTGVRPESSVQLTPEEATKWKGANLLGKSLMSVRSMLRERKSESPRVRS